MRPIKPLTIAIVFVALLLMFGGGIVPPQPPAPVYPAKVQAVAEAMKGFPMQAHQLGGFYASFVTTVQTMPPTATVGAFAAKHNTDLKAFVASTGYSGAPKVGALVDDSLAEVIGLVADDPLTPKKAALTTRVGELSQALQGVK